MRVFRGILLAVMMWWLPLSAAAATLHKKSDSGELWLPENGKPVRALVLAFDDRAVLENEAVRKVAADADLGLVWLATAEVKSSVPVPPGQRVAVLQQTLNKLAAEAGRPDVATVPLVLLGGRNPAGLVNFLNENGSRVAAVFAGSGTLGQKFPESVPVLVNALSDVDLASAVRLRRVSDTCLIGVAFGCGKGDRADGELAALFIRKAAQYGLTADGRIKRLEPRSGWLVKPEEMGNPGARAVPYRQWRGDPTRAFWYYDQELSQAVIDRLASGLNKYK